MTVIAEITCPASSFLLEETLGSATEVRAELEQLVPVNTDLCHYVWIVGSDRERIEDALRADRTVEAFQLLEAFENRWLYSVDWEIADRPIVQGIVDHDVAILAAEGSNSTWQLKLRFRNPEELSKFHTVSIDSSVEIALDRLYDPLEESLPHQLTPVQRETLLLAYEEGYFDIPRKITLVELGDLLEISDQSVSERLRRAQVNLISSTLLSDGSRE
jgi:hypothetical protein